ncbi:tRNA uridine-5-carboxymethylaminomethyl(34) synthesis GTPase MnmE [Lysobacter sp. TY2-98]|uniref:tRNA uridine-5-carboxymethylaminomethyl(34) synthesis GTPase MnmE n=1 Tax=Lysobacter sp. TY2-98 TaxID=2290922 RepID=UPI000E1FF951|nr:tRNA uridine-5-carboxymethylaminomethyl(34) synthesis GTPase MnmE [Lysobacter sp. TY2-98]AXK73208.1 tRNA uridine-5-carboxymethylaminomethyl(34) synthesis GTPase MnmE [Lysobacter sp. TY2-98]
MHVTSRETIAAIATAAGSAGVGIVRVSGSEARRIGEAIAQRVLTPRRAHHAQFRHGDDVIDDGLAIWFAAPASYTGEDVVELQAHGSPAVLAQLLEACLALGARPARPGEFTERAFLEGRLDLAQAEAVADLIAAADIRAARAARRALDGDFSRRVDALADALLHVRVHCEAAIDFADEPIDTLGGADLRRRLDAIEHDLDALIAAAEQGRRLRDGLHAVIVGPPNAGKSSLLNALAGVDRAIVTDIAGTTRDVLHETVRIEGVELTLVDTAGLRDSGDAIEREGMRRARGELERADLAIVVVDARDAAAGAGAVADAIANVPHVLRIANKIDLLDGPAPEGFIAASAMTGSGLDAVRRRLHALALGPQADTVQGAFTARTRHVHALTLARAELLDARMQLAHEHLDLAAEQLRRAHDALGEITGRVHADDLLGHIFSSFCIGK